MSQPTPLAAQVDRLFFSPLRAFAGVSLVYSELLLQSQVDLARACSTMSLTQARGALGVRTQADMRAYMERHLRLAESVRGQAVNEAVNLTSLNTLYAEQMGKLADTSIRHFREALTPSDAA